MNWYDRLVVSSALGGKYVVTSPNANFIPQPPEGRVTVSMKIDGKYGVEDPLHHPQLFNDDYRVYYLSCIPRPTDPLRRSEIWSIPSEGDYQEVTAKGAAQLVKLTDARLSPIEEAIEYLFGELIEYEADNEKSQQLRWNIISAKHAYERLTHPATRRDLLRQLACVERQYCTAIALIIWHYCFKDVPLKPAPVKPTLMGCFTTDGSVVAKLTQVGIPVWYMRLGEAFVQSCERVINVVDLMPPSDIPTEDYSPRSVIYVGTPGLKQLESIYQKGHVYADIEAIPLPENFGAVSSTLADTPSTSDNRTKDSDHSYGVQRPSKASAPRQAPCKSISIIVKHRLTCAIRNRR